MVQPEAGSCRMSIRSCQPQATMNWCLFVRSEQHGRIVIIIGRHCRWTGGATTVQTRCVFHRTVCVLFSAPCPGLAPLWDVLLISYPTMGACRLLGEISILLYIFSRICAGKCPVVSVWDSRTVPESLKP